MRIRRFALAVAGLSLVTGAAAAGQAAAGVQSDPGPRTTAGKSLGQTPQTKAVAAACQVAAGAITATGLNSSYLVTATKPVGVAPLAPFQLFGARSSSTWYAWRTPKAVTYYAGFVLQGTNLYAGAETYSRPEGQPPVTSSKRLGTGWGGFTALTSSNYYVSGTTRPHLFLYGLHTNGSLYRYSVNGPTGPITSYGSAPGYGSFKSITVISETLGYDTILATTKAGALWTIHLPVTAPLKGTLKAVRTTGFKSYDKLVASRCGSSTLLTGFNNTAKTLTVFAMSKANGSKTIINTIGSAPATHNGVTHFLYTGSGSPSLIGE
ncbi:hypothetical protein [Kribbella sp. NPDC051620]|uniref:hypothetical protein n=1 Tax=Kribbella sp. NPDC051620 TaxID=3364120 RepID=UPI003794A196